MPAALTPMLRENVPKEVIDKLPTEQLDPEYVSPLPVVLMSDAASDITGWTFAIAGETVFTLTDPMFDQERSMEGGWQPVPLADAIDDMLIGRPRSKTEPGGLIGKLTED
jgi:hypothetical protein